MVGQHDCPVGATIAKALDSLLYADHLGPLAGHRAFLRPWAMEMYDVWIATMRSESRATVEAKVSVNDVTGLQCDRIPQRLHDPLEGAPRSITPRVCVVTRFRNAEG